jgi:lipopolysaccharide/colanic/teichoic acid biosynthesis glycosyltransferase
MLKNSPAIGTGTVTIKNDPRILPIGHFLRKTKINELPQLLNILFGDMSVIGPRPQTQRCFDAFTATSQAAIVQVRPGLSGIGSIIFRDEENLLHGQADSVRFYDEVIAPYKGALEEWYVVHQGLVDLLYADRPYCVGGAISAIGFSVAGVCIAAAATSDVG